MISQLFTYVAAGVCVCALVTSARRQLTIDHAIRVALTLHDIYRAYLAWVLSCAHTIHIAIIRRMSATDQTCRLLYAASGANRTFAFDRFLATDRLRSPASLRRWLSNFGDMSAQRYVDVIFARDDIVRRSRLDLDDELEVYTGYPVDEIALDVLPSVRLFEN